MKVKKLTQSDLGAMKRLLPFIGSNEEERRIMYNAAGPFWDGNEVWLISAGGVTFAAFPKVYAVMFSALYAPLLSLLFASSAARWKAACGAASGIWSTSCPTWCPPCCWA